MSALVAEGAVQLGASRNVVKFASLEAMDRARSRLKNAAVPGISHFNCLKTRLS